MQLPIADLRLNSLNHPLYEVDVTRSRHQTFDREAVKGVGGERGSALPGAQWLLQPKWAGTKPNTVQSRIPSTSSWFLPHGLRHGQRCPAGVHGNGNE